MSQQQDLLQIVLVVNLLVGLLELLGGYVLWRLICGVNGLAIGAFCGALLAAEGKVTEPAGVIGAAIVGAIVCAGLLAAVKPLGSFIVGGLNGVQVVNLVLGVVLPAVGARPHLDQQSALVAGIAIAVVIGIVVACGDRPAIIHVTAAHGAAAVVGSALVLQHASRGSEAILNQLFFRPLTPGQLGLIGVLAGVGLALQLSTTKAEKPRGSDTSPVGSSANEFPVNLEALRAPGSPAAKASSECVPPHRQSREESSTRASSAPQMVPPQTLFTRNAPDVASLPRPNAEPEARSDLPPIAPEGDDALAVADRLRTLKSWHDQNLIGSEEYEQKRRDLLARL